MGLYSKIQNVNIDKILYHLLFSTSRQRIGGGCALQGGKRWGPGVGNGRGGGGVGGIVQQRPCIPHSLLAILVIVSDTRHNVKVIIGAGGVEDILVAVISTSP